MHRADKVDILLIEDNPEDVELILRAFRRLNMASPIHHIKDGAEALDYIFCRGDYAARNASSKPKVILLDLKLPKISGLEVLKMLKTDERTQDIPVVVVTSSREDPDIQAAYALGANSYVVKMVDFNSFIESMSNLGLYWVLVNQPPV
ncbi:response regulator [Kiritimatiellaeota bacterium B1221]|nr:response regulator [Kiritimatiellaeota bacterium B1221]